MKELKACCGFGHRIIYQNITEKVNRAVFEAYTLGCKVFIPEQWVNLTLSLLRLS